MSGTARTRRPPRRGEFRAAVTMAAATAGWRGEGEEEREGREDRRQRKVLLDSEGREAKRLAVSAANNSN